MVFLYTSQVVLSFAQYFVAFINYHLSLLRFITVTRSHPMSKILFLIELTKWRCRVWRSKIEYWNFFISLWCPARQFLKAIKGDNGYCSCEQCEIQDLYESSRIGFHTIDCTPCVNDIFNNYGYAGKHQFQRSCLIYYGIICINGFPLDSMHLVCLGVVIRLILFWNEGPHRLSPAQLSQMWSKMEEMTGLFPSEFVRQPGGFDEVKRSKATELQEFLLYSGCVVLKDNLTHEYYKHFLMLSLAMKILLDENENVRSHYLTYARDLMRCFVARCQQLYGNTFTVYNVHGLLHLWEDSNFFKKPLDEISSFSFENYL